MWEYFTAIGSIYEPYHSKNVSAVSYKALSRTLNQHVITLLKHVGQININNDQVRHGANSKNLTALNLNVIFVAVEIVCSIY